MRPSELGHHIGALGTLSSAGTSQNKDNERGSLLARHIRILQAVASCKSRDLVGSHRPISAQHVLIQVQESISGSGLVHVWDADPHVEGLYSSDICLDKTLELLVTFLQVFICDDVVKQAYVKTDEMLDKR
jgi:hypothetical protein